MTRSGIIVRTLFACAALAGAGGAASAQYHPPAAYLYPPPYPADLREDAEADIVIHGRYGPRPEDAETASAFVSYADLDLYYPEDRRELRRRVSITARDLCERLGEDGRAAYGTSCRDAATRDALRRVGTVEARLAPRDTAWIR